MTKSPDVTVATSVSPAAAAGGRRALMVSSSKLVCVCLLRSSPNLKGRTTPARTVRRVGLQELAALGARLRADGGADRLPERGTVGYGR